jgi:hypothetical protein
MSTQLSAEGLQIEQQSSSPSGVSGSALLYTKGNVVYMNANNGGEVQLTPFDIDQLNALGGANLHETQDHFVVSDNGTEKKILFEDVANSIFANVSGDATIAASGSLTIGSAAVEEGMLNDNVISGQDELAHADIADADELLISDGGTLKRVGIDSLQNHYYGNVSGDATIADGGALTIGADAVESGMLNDNVISGQSALGSAAAAQADEMLFSDGGTLKKITFSNLEDSIFGNVSGDATVAAGGALTIAANAVQTGMVHDDVATELAQGAGLEASSGQMSVSAAQTSITSIINASLAKIGTNASQEYVTFGTSNEVNTFINNTERLSVTAAGADVTGDLSLSGTGSISGDLTVSGDLTIAGVTTQVNSTEVNIADKAIVLASGSTAAQIRTAGGAGFKISHETGAEASFLYDADATTAMFDSSAHLNVASGKKYYVNATEVLSADGAVKVQSGVAGDGLAHSAGVLSVTVDDTGIEINSDTLRLKDNGVTLAKMAGITRGSIILGDSSGDPSLLAKGASGRFLQSDGTDPSYVAMSGDATLAAGGAVTLAAAQTNVTSMLNAGLTVGRDTDNVVDFATADDVIILKAAGSERMRADAAGVDVVGTLSASVAVQGGAATLASISCAGTAGFSGGYSGGGTGVSVNADGDLFANGDLTIDGTANFGGAYSDGGSGLSISAGGDLSLNGTLTVGSSGEGVDVKFHGTNASDSLDWDASANKLLYKDAGTLYLSMGGESSDYAIDVGNGSAANAGNRGKIRAAAFVTYSDRNLKKDIAPMNDALDKVMALDAVSYKMKNDDRQEIGFIAQDVAKIVPEVCALDANGEGRGIDYSRMTALLAGAMKSQQAQIENLQKVIANLQK